MKQEILAAIAKARKIDAEGHGYDAMVEAVDEIERIVSQPSADTEIAGALRASVGCIEGLAAQYGTPIAFYGPVIDRAKAALGETKPLAESP